MSNELVTVHDWVTPAEDAALCAEFESAVRAMDKRMRRVVRFGAFQPYNHGVRRTRMPDSLDSLALRLLREGHLQRHAENVLVNFYAANQGLPAHVDAADAGDEIAVLSLQSNAQMRWARGEHVEITELPARTLMVMRGARRWDWTHEVLPVAAPRASIVFRYRR